MEQNPYEPPVSVKPDEPQPIESQLGGGSRMDGPELFGVLVRAIGLYFILRGVADVVTAMFHFSGFVHTASYDPWLSSRAAVENLAPGIIAFFFSNAIVRLAYGAERSEPPSDEP